MVFREPAQCTDPYIGGYSRIGGITSNMTEIQLWNINARIYSYLLNLSTLKIIVTNNVREIFRNLFFRDNFHFFKVSSTKRKRCFHFMIKTIFQNIFMILRLKIFQIFHSLLFLNSLVLKSQTRWNHQPNTTYIATMTFSKPV